MTNKDTTFKLSRRKALASLGGIGVASAGAGLGTSAYFNDTESFTDNSLTAGELDLKVDWQQRYWGAPQEERPQDYGDAGRPYVNAHPDDDEDGMQSIGGFTYDKYDRNLGDDDGVDYCEDVDHDFYFGADQDSLVDISDVKPGDCWETTFSYHLCDNPGWVWLRSLNETFTDIDGEDKSEDHLADRAIARVWYDMADGEYTVPTYEENDAGELVLLPEDEWDTVEADPGDNEYNPGADPIIAQGSLRDVLTDLREGVLLRNDPLSAPVDDGGHESGDDGECVELEKFDATPTEDDVGVDLDLDGDVDDDVTFTITDLYRDRDGDVIGFDWESNYGICLVSVKGGQPTEQNVYDCAFSGTAFSPLRTDTRRFEISHFVPWYCPDVNGTEEPPEPECTENSTTRYIGFEWCLPTDTGNEVQGDSIQFDLQFYTEQCRHNENPEDPFV